MCALSLKKHCSRRMGVGLDERDVGPVLGDLGEVSCKESENGLMPRSELWLWDRCSVGRTRLLEEGRPRGWKHLHGYYTHQELRQQWSRECQELSRQGVGGRDHYVTATKENVMALGLWHRPPMGLFMSTPPSTPIWSLHSCPEDLSRILP